MYFVLIFPFVAEDYHWPIALSFAHMIIIISYKESNEAEQFLTYIFSCT